MILREPRRRPERQSRLRRKAWPVGLVDCWASRLKRPGRKLRNV